MDEARKREKSLFEEALEFADPVDRGLFLDRACHGDAALRRRIDELLAVLEPSEDYLSSIPGSTVADREQIVAGKRPALSDTPVRIGRYKPLRRLGTGGCGVVYLAEQQEPVRRQVALKIVRLGMDTESVIARFELERQALAMMDHPSIARVLDAGATESGRPYFVMELVNGIKITDYCDQERLTTAQRLSLFVLVCHAIQHAHQKGIVHRDIKPSNILVTLQDGVPIPKVIDFGIAKAMQGNLAEETLVTGNLQMVGTPAYMSPEQTEFGHRDLDTRSDIYSLGVVLYELLTGRPPFDSKQLIQSGIEEMRRTIREREPPRPSALLESLPARDLKEIAERQGVEPRKLVSMVRGDLDWIVTTTLEKDRARRYETANRLALDVQRHLRNEEVSARPPSRLYHLHKLVSRNRVVVSAGCLILLILLIGLGASTWLFLRERDARREQVRLTEMAGRASAAEMMLREQAERARAAEIILREQAETREKITQAAISVMRGDMRGADALVANIPESLVFPSLEYADVQRALGEWHAKAGRWQKSARCHLILMAAIPVSNDSESDYFSRSLPPAAAGIRNAGVARDYEHFRQLALHCFSETQNPLVAERLLSAALLAPSDPFTLRILAPLADVVADTMINREPGSGADPSYAWRCFSLGLFAHRRDLPGETLRWADQSLAFANMEGSRTVSVNLLRTMAMHRLGKKNEARRELNRNRGLIEARFQRSLWMGGTAEGFWYEWINAQILLREATEMIGN